MTQREFQEWLKYHRSGFTGLNNWLARLPEPGYEREGEPSRQDVLKRWFFALKDVVLGDAVDATDAMFNGNLPEPKGWDRHPAAIRLHALRNRDKRSYRPQRVDGEETFDCPLCLDGGWVSVWHPKSMAAARQGRLGEPNSCYTIAVACQCPAGKAGVLRYDENKMLRIDGCIHDEKEQNKLVEFMARGVEVCV